MSEQQYKEICQYTHNRNSYFNSIVGQIVKLENIERLDLAHDVYVNVLGNPSADVKNYTWNYLRRRLTALKGKEVGEVRYDEKTLYRADEVLTKLKDELLYDKIAGKLNTIDLAVLEGRITRKQGSILARKNYSYYCKYLKQLALSIRLEMEGD